MASQKNGLFSMDTLVVVVGVVVDHDIYIYILVLFIYYYVYILYNHLPSFFVGARETKTKVKTWIFFVTTSWIFILGGESTNQSFRKFTFLRGKISAWREPCGAVGGSMSDLRLEPLNSQKTYGSVLSFEILCKS